MRSVIMSKHEKTVLNALVRHYVEENVYLLE